MLARVWKGLGLAGARPQHPEIANSIPAVPYIALSQNKLKRRGPPVTSRRARTQRSGSARRTRLTHMAQVCSGGIALKQSEEQYCLCVRNV